MTLKCLRRLFLARYIAIGKILDLSVAYAATDTYRRFGAVVDAHDIDDALTQVCQIKEAAAVAAASPQGNVRKLEP